MINPDENRYDPIVDPEELETWLMFIQCDTSSKDFKTRHGSGVKTIGQGDWGEDEEEEGSHTTIDRPPIVVNTTDQTEEAIDPVILLQGPINQGTAHSAIGPEETKEKN